MQVGVADTAGLGLDQDLPRTGRGDVDLAQDQRLSKMLDDGGVHCLDHDGLLHGTGWPGLLKHHACMGPRRAGSETTQHGRAVVAARAGMLLHEQAGYYAGLMTLEMGKRIAGARGEVEAFVNNELIRILAGEALVRRVTTLCRAGRGTHAAARADRTCPYRRRAVRAAGRAAHRLRAGPSGPSTRP